MFTETTRLIRDGEKGVWRAKEDGDYIPIATLSAPEWAGMRAILMFH